MAAEDPATRRVQVAEHPSPLVCCVYICLGVDPFPGL
uniref:Galactokinase 2 n=1 Tax=Mus musculus TaxID=10090 RepID=D6RJ57_MOUSE